jgi:hypothetical protein
MPPPVRGSGATRKIAMHFVIFGLVKYSMLRIRNEMLTPIPSALSPGFKNAPVTNAAAR